MYCLQDSFSVMVILIALLHAAGAMHNQPVIRLQDRQQNPWHCQAVLLHNACAVSWPLSYLAAAASSITFVLPSHWRTNSSRVHLYAPHTADGK